MPSTPTTKSQVQAYRFVLRRMQSALVRKDAVMLHDPMRTHSRATAVGVVISALGMLGFLVVGMLSPKGGGPESESIVIGEESGAIYVATGEPMKLIPTFNLASARLLMAAQQQREQQGGEGGLNFSGGDEAGKEPQVVSDGELENIPKGRLTGIPDGPQLLPTPEQRISDNWAVCDKIDINRRLEDPANTDKPTSSVLGGIRKLGVELGENQAILGHAENDKVYLIYHVPPDPNRGEANVVRSEVAMNDEDVTTTFNLSPSNQREISMGLLNAIPEAKPLQAPQIAGAGEPSQHLSDMNIGNVFLTRTAGGDPKYWVVLQNGIQEVNQAVADLVRAKYQQGTTGMPQKEAAETTNVPHVSELDVDEFPGQVPTVLVPERFPAACLGWRVQGEGENREGVFTMHVGAELPKKDDGSKLNPVKIGQPGAGGIKVDNFFIPQGRGAVVHAATSRDSFRSGPIYLISDRGVKYGIPDATTAKVLGLEQQSPAPDSIVRLIPDGASLNTQDVLRTFDSVEVTPGSGSFENNNGSAQGGS
ncbi:MAG: type VII secretion protein EccB [Pseudonocardiaceae bacterium]|nr:type VII secretion protein EccB [Pseudonocardiaceae bacterium]